MGALFDARGSLAVGGGKSRAGEASRRSTTSTTTATRADKSGGERFLWSFARRQPGCEAYTMSPKKHGTSSKLRPPAADRAAQSSRVTRISRLLPDLLRGSTHRRTISNASRSGSLLLRSLRMSDTQVLRERWSGLDSCPAAVAEIFAERVSKKSPRQVRRRPLLAIHALLTSWACDKVHDAIRPSRDVGERVDNMSGRGRSGRDGGSRLLTWPPSRNNQMRKMRRRAAPTRCACTRFARGCATTFRTSGFWMRRRRAAQRRLGLWRHGRHGPGREDLPMDDRDAEGMNTRS